MIGGGQMCSNSPTTKQSDTLLIYKLELSGDKTQKSKPNKQSKKTKKEYSNDQKLQIKKHFSFKSSNELIAQCDSIIHFNAVADDNDINNQDIIIDTEYLKVHKRSFERMRNCSGRIEYTNGEPTKIFRCKNKLCPICSGIKQGK